MRVKARKVGNSLTVTIPKDVVIDMDLAEDTDLNIFVREGTVVLEPVASRWDRLVTRVRAQAGSDWSEADVAEEMERLRPGRFVGESAEDDVER